MEFDLNRFLEAQEEDYEIALKEIRNGYKESHYMWYIFPQVDGLGNSSTTKYYSIKSIEEAKAYADHPILGSRLREITEALLELEETDIFSILGFPDNLKLHSCMTLFYEVTKELLFLDVINKYFDGLPSESTLEIINSWRK